LEFDKKEFYRRRRELAERMSISGVQDKLSLHFTPEGKLEPTAVEGRYILKPIPSSEDLEHAEELPANEQLSMLLSRELFGIPTAQSALIEFSDGERAYITRRFDTDTATGLKCDQEDFASILERTSERNGHNYKYDASYEAIARAIRRVVAAYIPALEDLYRRILFNYLIGNGDAHLKNFSLYRLPGRSDWTLTPSYDLLYTRYHVPNELGYMALELFEDERETEAFRAMGYYTLQDFERFAEILKIPEKRLLKIFDTVLGNTPRVVETVERSYLSDEGKRVYLKNYLERLKLHLCYSVASFGFRGKTQPVIDRHREMIDRYYERYW
jgi:serine/threonine-protein kinase HipA